MIHKFEKIDFKYLKYLVRKLYYTDKYVDNKPGIIGFKGSDEFNTAETSFMISLENTGTTNAITFWINDGENEIISIYQFMVEYLSKEIVNHFYHNKNYLDKRSIHLALLANMVDDSNNNNIIKFYFNIFKTLNKNARKKTIQV